MWGVANISGMALIPCFTYIFSFTIMVSSITYPFCNVLAYSTNDNAARITHRYGTENQLRAGFFSFTVLMLTGCFTGMFFAAGLLSDFLAMEPKIKSNG